MWSGVLLSIFAINAFFQFPALVNADLFMNSDEAFVANYMINMLEGAPFHFYYEHNRYVGALVDFAVAPFIFIFGPVSFSFKLANIFVYSLYTWSLCLLVRPFGGFVVCCLAFFLLLPPPSILGMELSFLPHMMIGFLSNLCFLIYLKIVKSGGKRPYFFCLGFLMGFSVYIYTYSVLLVATLILVFVLTRDDWDRIRSHMNLSEFKSLFRNLTGRQKFIRFLDGVIILFILAIGFAYTFGGFGLDIAGVTILQINNLHRPLGQIAILLLIRYGLDRNAMAENRNRLKAYWNRLPFDVRQCSLLGAVGFALGLSPRIASILTGETKRGGQGFDMDFMPLRLVKHAWSLLHHDVPDLLGLFDPVSDFFASPFAEARNTLLFALSLIIICAFLATARFLFLNHRELLTKIFRFKKIKFSLELFFIIFPIVIICANIASQSGPLVRYLFPMYGAALFWLALFLKSQRGKNFPFIPGLMIVWAIFFSLTLYQKYTKLGMIEDGKVVRLSPDPSYEVIDFAKERKISLVYGGVNVFRISFLSERTLPVAEYSRSPRSKRRNKKAKSVQNFAVISRKIEKTEPILERYLLDNQIEYRKSVLKHHVIFWSFSGNRGAIDKLRTFFP